MGKQSIQPLFIFEDPNSSQEWIRILEQMLEALMTDPIRPLVEREGGGEL